LIGLIERKTTHWSSRQTKVPGISPSMIRLKMVATAADGNAPRRPD
jgi:hypothetical protein